MGDRCDPCVCTDMYYRDEESFRKAVIQVLCDIAQGSGPTPPATDRYLQEDGVFFYETEDGTGFYIQE